MLPLPTRPQRQQDERFLDGTHSPGPRAPALPAGYRRLLQSQQRLNPPRPLPPTRLGRRRGHPQRGRRRVVHAGRPQQLSALWHELQSQTAAQAARRRAPAKQRLHLGARYQHSAPPRPLRRVPRPGAPSAQSTENRRLTASCRHRLLRRCGDRRFRLPVGQLNRLCLPLQRARHRCRFRRRCHRTDRLTHRTDSSGFACLRARASGCAQLLGACLLSRQTPFAGLRRCRCAAPKAGELEGKHWSRRQFDFASGLALHRTQTRYQERSCRCQPTDSQTPPQWLSRRLLPHAARPSHLRRAAPVERPRSACPAQTQTCRLRLARVGRREMQQRLPRWRYNLPMCQCHRQ
jgi:hypothetical protein